MSFLKLIFVVLSCSLLVGCLGGGGGDANTSATDNTASDVGDTQDPNNPNEPSDPNDPSDPQPDPGPQPGDIVEQSEGVQGVTYPEPGTTTVNYDRNPKIEPNSDNIKPIIAITHHPANYIPNTSGTIELWAADNDNGIGLQSISCDIDGSGYSDCSEQVDLTNLSEGLHTIKARAVDYDDNESGEVSYTFYVDTTPPQVIITQAPEPMNSESQAQFQFSSNDDGSGVSHYECSVDGGGFSQCQESQALDDLSEGSHNLVVRTVDSVGNKSDEVSHNWVVDQSAPVIQVNKRPPSQIYTGSVAVINYSVTDTYSPNGITVMCQLNGMAVSCAADQDLSIPSSSPMNYNFVITATDSIGNSSQRSIQWESVNIAENRTTNQSVGEDRPVDILFVVDNSGSMDYERKNLADRIDGMIDKIKDLNWQIAVTSTDMTNDDFKSNGRLLEFEGMSGTYVLNPSMDPAQAQYSFGQTIQNFGNGSGTEEGILASKKVIERAVAGETPHRNFIRDGADLSIVVLSDEDEASNGSGVDTSPQQFVNFVNNTYNGQKNMVFHSIISRPGDQDCANGEGYNVGHTYDELSRLTGYGQLGGAIIGSVCEADYTSQLADIGQSVKDLQNSINLDCNPFDSNSDGSPDVSIVYRADAGSQYQSYNAPYQVQNQKLIFDDLLPPGDYKVDYQCRIN